MLQMTRESCRAALHCRPCGPRKFENDEKSGFSGGCGCHDDKRNAQKQQRHTRAMTAPVQKTNTLTSRSHSCTQKGPVKFCTASRKCGGAGCRKMAGPEWPGMEALLAPCQRCQRRLTRSPM